jgi:hypothetical protein
LPDTAEVDNFVGSPDIRDTGMIDFYALTSPNVQKIYIMLEETRLTYKGDYQIAHEISKRRDRLAQLRQVLDQLLQHGPRQARDMAMSGAG